MSYFNHAFIKTFVATNSSVVTSATPSANIATGQLALCGPNFAALNSATGTLNGVADTPYGTANGLVGKSLVYLVQGSLMLNDKIGSHGGFQESVKSKGINPKYITGLWKQVATAPGKGTLKIIVGPTCFPCNSTVGFRLDIKGSPALRFLNRNIYAVSDNLNTVGTQPLVTNATNCCTGTTVSYMHPAVALTRIILGFFNNPLIAPFINTSTTQELRFGTEEQVNAASGGTPRALNSTAALPTDTTQFATFTIEFKSTDDIVDYFGFSSHDTRDHNEVEPLQMTGSLINENGEICSTCVNSATSTRGNMGKGATATKVVNDLLLTSAYAQTPFSQGNKDSARIREILGFGAPITDSRGSQATATNRYNVYYIEHSVPRFNNPTSTFDNDQYLYQIYVKNNTAANTVVDNILSGLAAASGIAYGTAQSL